MGILGSELGTVSPSSNRFSYCGWLRNPAAVGI